MEWFEHAFNEDYDRIYMHTFTPERNTGEAQFIKSGLNLAKGSKVLDIACGHGRHALLLGADFKMTGVDLSERFIAMAQEAAKRLKSNARFEVGDMRRLKFKNEFDGAYCYFTSFGYFPHRENVTALNNVSKALRKGGRFLLETANRDWHLHRVEAQPRRWEEITPGYLYLEDASFNARTGRIHTRRIIIDGAERRELEFDYRLYSLAEIEDMIERAGMRIVSTFGGRDRLPFSISSPRMIIVSEKS
ncbi:MAG: class I SAM-dependent methyltransferase [Acidobacteriia bacterium]|nr:class I SAM-dependent methyltransferase [Terriglobia bacterium]